MVLANFVKYLFRRGNSFFLVTLFQFEWILENNDVLILQYSVDTFP